MFRTNPVSLKKLLDDVENLKIQLPDFQRGWVWDDDRIKGLLASISRGFPVGAIMTLISGGEIKLKTRTIEGVEGNGSDSAEAFLLDGQQRLTSLYQALRHPGPVDTHDARGKRIKRWYYIDMQKALDSSIDREEAVLSVPENRKVTEDFGRRTVLDLSDSDLEYHQHMVPTEQLFDMYDWLWNYEEYWRKSSFKHPSNDVPQFSRKFKNTVAQEFAEYSLPVIELSKETPKEAVCTVFEKVNTGGVTLNVFELATASFASDVEGFSLRDDWDKRRHRMYTFGVLQGVQGDQFLQTVALLKTLADRKVFISEGNSISQAPAVGCKKRDILGLKLEDYIHWADRVEEGFIAAAKFMRNQFVFGQRNVPYNTQLIPMAALHVELGEDLETAIGRSRLEHWFWSGIFGEVYGSAIETQFALDLVQVSDYVRHGIRPVLLDQASFAPERLVTLRTRNSAAYKGLYALQMKSGAKNWKSSESISLMSFHDESIDIHHVFPKAWCRNPQRSIPSKLYDSIVNKTPIDAHTNRKIGGHAPSVYLPMLRKEMNPDIDIVLESHWFASSDLYNDNFRKSFLNRGEAMLDLIGQAMGRNLGNGRDVLDELAKDYLNADASLPSSVNFEEEEEYNEYVENEIFNEPNGTEHNHR